MKLLPLFLVASGALFPAAAFPEPASAAPAEPAARKGADVKDPKQKAVASWLSRHRGKAGEAAFDALLSDVAERLPAFAPGGPQEDPRWKSLRALLPAAPENAASAKQKRRTKATKGPKEERAFPLPMIVEYRFGLREPVALGKQSALAAALAKGEAKPADLPLETRMEALGKGCLPATELTIAAIEQALDVDATADPYAKFLDEWRNSGPNGDESFYEALDRTAGTEEAVFFYDAMLADFVSRFAQEEGKRWSLDQRHDFNQQAFLAYRQYRGMIEAIAFALVLPPDVALPKRLERYDYSSVQLPQFSLRHQVDLLAAAEHDDAKAVIEFARGFFEKNPLPAKLWEGYDGAAAFGTAVQPEYTKAVNEHGLPAAELFTKVRDERQRRAEELRAAVLESVQAADHP